jgi:uncharacterized UBP type Zn finger protein
MDRNDCNPSVSKMNFCRVGGMSDSVSYNTISRNCLYPLSLQDALDHFLRKEMIEYKCEECGHKKSEVTHKFAKLPR